MGINEIKEIHKKISIFYMLRIIITCAAIIAFIPIMALAKEQNGKKYGFEGNGTRYDESVKVIY